MTGKKQKQNNTLYLISFTPEHKESPSSLWSVFSVCLCAGGFKFAHFICLKAEYWTTAGFQPCCYIKWMKVKHPNDTEEKTHLWMEGDLRGNKVPLYNYPVESGTISRLPSVKAGADDGMCKLFIVTDFVYFTEHWVNSYDAAFLLHFYEKL